MPRRHPRNAAGSLPVLAASFAPTTHAHGGGTPSARSVARLFPLGSGGERILLAVAEGVGDPPSAEAQAAEALSRLEAVVARAGTDALPEDLLDAGLQAAAEGVRRLTALPGSVRDAGVALAAVITEDGTIAVANAGHGAVFLQRAGVALRLTPAQSDEAPSLAGAGGEQAQAIALSERLRPGDTLMIASERIVRGLGARVIEAVFEEYGPEGAADELSTLAAELPEAPGAAVALLHLPATATAAGAARTGVTMRNGGGRSSRLIPLAVLGAIVLGIAAAVAIVLATSRGGNKASNTRTARTQAGAPQPALTAQAASLTAAAAASSTPAATATPGASPTPNASATPLSPASLPTCSGPESKPCSYTVQSGDSASAIGVRFGIPLPCFEAANLRHEPVAPQAPDFVIFAGDTYVIPDDATCARLPTPSPSPAAGTATPAAGTTTPAAGTATPAATGTPAAAGTPSAATPTATASGTPAGLRLAPAASTAAGVAAAAGMAAAAPAPNLSSATRRGP
jgi:hypothetical protein